MDYPWAVPGAKVTPTEGEWRGDARVDRPQMGAVYTITEAVTDPTGEVCLLLDELVSSFGGEVYAYPAVAFRPLISQADDIAMFRRIASDAQNSIHVSEDA
jgi:hypothetical protein